MGEFNVEEVAMFKKEESIKAIARLESTLNINFSNEQKEILMHYGGMCIIACAGAGKTSVLTSLIAKRILTNEIMSTDTLLCTTYSKGGAQEMEERLNNVLKQLGIVKTVQVKTMHAMYLGVLKFFGYPSTVISNSDRRKYIIEACKDVDWYPDDEEYQLLDSLLSYQINNLLSDNDITHSYVFTLDNLSGEDYSKIRKGYNTRKSKARVIDFDDMQLYMYSLLYNQNDQGVLNYCRSLWKDIYVDEAQDMSRIQYAILRKIISDSKRLVLVGDDDQCIYQWRGADPNIILNVCADYDIERFVLSTNYRCAGKIVEKAAVGIVHNKKRSNKSMKPYNDGGEIKICDYGDADLYGMSKYAYVYIKDLVKSGENPKDIAVLSRNNAHLCILNNLLFKDGVYCEATNDMKITKNPIYYTIKNVLELSKDTYSQMVVASTLYKLCLYMRKTQAKAVADFQGASGLRLSDALGYILTKILGVKNVAWNKQVNIPNLAVAKVSHSLEFVRCEVVESLVDLYNLLTQLNEKQRFAGCLSMLLIASDFIYGITPDRKRTFNGLVSYFSILGNDLGIEKLSQFLRATEQYESGNSAIPGDKVCMSTMHGAKGKEWKHVIMFADDNVTFPSFSGINSQLMSGVTTTEVCNGIDENRRLHYVAMTRAKQKLMIFTNKENIGVYLLESLGIMDFRNSTEKKVENTEGVSVNDIKIIEMSGRGSLDDNLVEASNAEIFSEGSQYFCDIDISTVDSIKEMDQSLFITSSQNTISLDSLLG